MNQSVSTTVLELLREAQSRLPHVYPPCHPWEVPGWMSRRTLAQVNAVDDTIRQWLKSRQWPELSPEDQAELHLRIKAAIDLLSKPEAQQMVEGKNAATVLTELLINFWHIRGIQWVGDRYQIGIGTPNAQGAPGQERGL